MVSILINISLFIAQKLKAKDGALFKNVGGANRNKVGIIYLVGIGLTGLPKSRCQLSLLSPSFWKSADKNMQYSALHTLKVLVDFCPV